jgi:ABC-type molybdate transport system ATPase subunit
MTYFRAAAKKIVSNDMLTLVYFDVMGSEVVMMSLEMDRKLRVGQGVRLGVKPTAIALLKEECRGSFANSLPVQVTGVEEGELLSMVKFQLADNACEAILIRQNLQALDIRVGDKVFAVFMVSELSVQEIYDA